jgi:ABC-2 type transport system permease protein
MSHGVAALPALDPHQPARLTFPHLVHSELIKVRSLRASWWCALIMAAAGLGLAGLIALTARAEGNADVPTLATNMTTTATMMIIQPVALIMGCLFASIEYGSGAIRTSLAAAPRRWQLLTAKTAAIAAALAVAALATVAVAFVAMFALMRARGFAVVCGGHDVARLAGLVGYGIVLGLIGFLLGFLTRSAVGGIGIGLGLTLVLPMIVTLGSSQAWVARIGDALPEAAARQFFQADSQADLVAGLVTVAVWLAAGFIATGVLFQRRDA